MADPNPKAELQKLITLHRRRLQKLQEQRARQGQNTDPAILIEIEDIEAELQQLEEQVEMETKASHNKPAIDPAQLESYLRCVGDELRHLDFSLFQEGQEREFAHVSLDRFYVPLRIAGRPAFEEEGLSSPADPPSPPL